MRESVFIYTPSITIWIHRANFPLISEQWHVILLWNHLAYFNEHWRTNDGERISIYVAPSRVAQCYLHYVFFFSFLKREEFNVFHPLKCTQRSQSLFCLHQCLAQSSFFPKEKTLWFPFPWQYYNSSAFFPPRQMVPEATTFPSTSSVTSLFVSSTKHLLGSQDLNSPTGKNTWWVTMVYT